MNRAHAAGAFSRSPAINTIGRNRTGTSPAKKENESVIEIPLHGNLRRQTSSNQESKTT
jgi:hypothetical protein